MRCIVGEKGLRRLRAQTGLALRRATVRGNTGHAVWALVEERGGLVHYTLERRGRVVTGWQREEDAGG